MESSSARILEPHLAQVHDSRYAYPSARPTPNVPPLKKLTCRFWLKTGSCKYSEEACKYAHHHTGHIEPKKNSVCKFWQQGGCRFKDEECEYIHGEAEDINGYWNERRTDSERERRLPRRSESPAHAGLRQDEVERRVTFSRRADRAPVASPSMASPSMASPSMASPSMASTSSFGTQREARPSVSTARVGQATTYTLPFQHRVDEALPPVESDVLPPAAPVLSPKIMPDTIRNVLTVADVDQETDLHEVSARLHINPSGPQTNHAIDIRLAFDQKSSWTKFLSKVGQEPFFECREFCLSRNFEEYWYQQDKLWTSGDVVCGPDDPVADHLNDYLVLNSAGAVVRTEEYVMVIYPTNGPDWRFLQNRGPEKMGLRFFVQSTIPDTLEAISPHSVQPNANKSTFATMCEKYLDLRADELFAFNRGKKHDKAVYLFFPRDAPETRVLENYLADIGAKIFHFHECDLWIQFCQGEKGPNKVILFHPSMQEYWKIPNFYWVLQGRSDNIFQVGVDATVRNRREAAVKHSCVRLFPYGSLTLITDDIFKYHSDLAFQVLESFSQTTRMKPQGGRCDRICTRPGLLAWLSQLIDEDHEAGILTEDSDRIKVWKIACDLISLEGAETSTNAFRANKSAPPVLYSPQKFELPDYGKTWDSSEEMATDFLAEWFAGMCIDERENFRRFTVLYELHGKPAVTPGVSEFKDPKEWMKKWQHIKVTTPSRWLKYEKQKEEAKARRG